MHHQEQQLQRLRYRFNQWLPWLRQAARAEVLTQLIGQGPNFKVTARWIEEGVEKQYEKTYDAALLLRIGYVSCTRDYARHFVRDVLEKRGI